MFSEIKKILGLDSDREIIEDRAYIIDVRSNAEYALGHIESAVNIPLEIIEDKIEELKRHHQIILYCRSGNRSGYAKKILNAAGISKVIDVGSMESAHELIKATGFFNAEIVQEEIEDISKNIAKDSSVLKILIPTDFSVQADFSYLIIKRLEEHLTLETHFMHVLDVPDTVTLDSDGNIQTCGEVDRKYIDNQMQIALKKLQHLKDSYGDNIYTHLKFGKLADTIIASSEEMKFDLIVMGTKDVWGLKELLTTTKSQLIVRKSEVPVLTMMCDRSDLIINDILYVHDFTDGDNTEIALMHKFADIFDAHIHMLHINEIASKYNKEEVLSNMHLYEAKHGLKNTHHHIIESKEVEQGVKEFLKKQDADIVFIGTHGQGSFFHKSAAETLVKHLFKPIVTFHFK